MCDVTVITPFHNVDMEIFENCFQSMINQSMGIDNIEWIIVLHNCEQQYIDAVKEKVNQYKSVITPILNNDANTPSSPRNYGLTMATGEYIGFLDGDDSYLTTCLETALKNIKSSKSDILCFKREYEMEDANQVAIGEGILLDQTKESLVFNKYSWEAEKTFVSVWGMVTSKIYSHEFIKKNNLKFSEDIPFAEDAAFNLIAYPLASNICYLTQYVGYHYYINSGSLVQCSAKDAKTLISYAKGYEKIFSIGMKNGLFMNNMIGGLLYHMARFLEVSDIDTESRREIRDILLPYLRIVKPFDVCEIYTEDDVKLRYDFPKAIIPDVKDIPIWEDDTKKSYPLAEVQKYQEFITEADGFGVGDVEIDRFYEISEDVDEEQLRKAVKETLDAHDVYRIRVKDSVMKISDDMPVASLYYFTEKLFKEYKSFSYERNIDSENEPPMQIDVICCVEDFSDYDKDAKNELVGKKYLHIKASHYAFDQVSLCNLFDEITNRYNEAFEKVPKDKMTIIKENFIEKN